MSAHLAVLARAGLAKGERHSRSIVYRADLEGLRTLMLYLLKDCCAATLALRSTHCGADRPLLPDRRSPRMTDVVIYHNPIAARRATRLP